MYQWPFFRTVLQALERLTVPGIMLHYVLRKRYLEETAVRSIAEGTKQVVILAAGFDTLACRLSRQFPDVLFIEVDHPATQKVKKRLVEETEWDSQNLLFLEVDFSKDSLEDKFRAIERFNRDKRSLFIMEGITMYLTEAEIGRLFNFITQNEK